MDRGWKAKLIAQINKASDFESLKAGLLALLADENGPGVATSQESEAQGGLLPKAQGGQMPGAQCVSVSGAPSGLMSGAHGGPLSGAQGGLLSGAQGGPVSRAQGGPVSGAQGGPAPSGPCLKDFLKNPTLPKPKTGKALVPVGGKGKNKAKKGTAAVPVAKSSTSCWHQ